MDFQFKYFSNQALYNLRYYKYSAEDRSYLVKWFLKAFWDWIVSFFPLWVAPNLITASGFVLILINFICLVIYSPHFDTECPSWVYISWVVGIFVYQVLDNIDGKQARRTKSSTPLGEIFDHGCDSLFATLSVVTLCATFLFSPWKSHLFMLSIIITFYCSHWEEWHTGKLILSAYGNPTESQLLMCVAHLFSFFMGPSWWNQPISSVGNSWIPFVDWRTVLPTSVDLNVNDFVTILFSVLTIISVLENTYVVAKTIIYQNKSAIKAFLVLAPLLSNAGVSTLWYWISPARILENYPLMCICFTGLLCSYTLDRMLLDRITKIDFNPLKWVFILPFLGLFNAWINPLPFVDVALMVIFLVVLSYSYIHLALGVIYELTQYLKINCFTIPYPPPENPVNLAPSHPKGRFSN